jgi:Lon protease-like protein
MGEMLELRKYRIINEITHANDLHFVEQLEAFLKGLRQQIEIEKQIFRPLRDNYTVEDLFFNHKPIDRVEFDRLIEELDIQEPLETLLAQTK